MSPAHFNATVRAELARRQQTYGDLAELLGLNRAAISRRLAGKTQWRVNELLQLADHFHMTVCELVGEKAS